MTATARSSLANIFRTKTQEQQNSKKSSRTNSNVDTLKKSGHTIYLIRHGEKPPKLENGHDAKGLSEEGRRRAQGLIHVFGKESKYNIGYIFAQQYKPDGARKRAYDTVLPVAKDLGLQVDTSVERDDIKSIVAALKNYDGKGNILISWEHKALTKIMDKIGVDGKFKYPKKRFDVIWAVKAPYNELHSWTSEGIEGLDDMHKLP